MRRFWKVLYVICRQSALFGLPGLRPLRNAVYNRHLGTSGINVDDFVRIAPAHSAPGHGIMKIGKDLHISRNAEVDATGNITLGDRITISEGAKIFTHDHIVDGCGVNWREAGIKCSPLIIEDDAWIGADAIILQSVSRIGYGAIVASGSVVRLDVEPLSVVAGCPAKPIRQRQLGAEL